jgi:hypothetical protein
VASGASDGIGVSVGMRVGFGVSVGTGDAMRVGRRGTVATAVTVGSIATTGCVTVGATTVCGARVVTKTIVPTLMTAQAIIPARMSHAAVRIFKPHPQPLRGLRLPSNAKISTHYAAGREGSQVVVSAAKAMTDRKANLRQWEK